jgi:sugar phosphate isomerase/epimerase
MKRLAIGILSDEIMPDFSKAAEYGISWGITLFELRTLRTGRVPDVDAEELREVDEVVRSRGLRITALSPGIFKHPLSDEEAIHFELETLLPETLSMAKKLRAPLVIAFGFRRREGEPPDGVRKAVEYMRQAAAAAERRGLKLAVENEPGFWCDSGSATASFIRKVGSAALGANWDPANAVGSQGGERAFPEGYRAVREVLVNVHVKDTRAGTLVKCVPVGEGVLDWRGQLRALARDGRVGHVTIETHCEPLISKSKLNVTTIQHYLKDINLDD